MKFSRVFFFTKCCWASTSFVKICSMTVTFHFTSFLFTSLHQGRKEISPCTPHSSQTNCVKFHIRYVQVTSLQQFLREYQHNNSHNLLLDLHKILPAFSTIFLRSAEYSVHMSIKCHWFNLSFFDIGAVKGTLHQGAQMIFYPYLPHLISDFVKIYIGNLYRLQLC